MKFTRAGKRKIAFRLDDKETALLLSVLNRYPRIISARQPLSKTAPSKEDEANQRLLDEALAEQRHENKRHLEALLNDKQRFEHTKTGSALTLTPSEIEWLLQILNDVRVGSWILLGAPENDLWDFELNETTAPAAWAMEAAGFFQMRLLEALEGRASR